MKSSQTTIKMIVVLSLLALVAGFLAWSHAADRPPRPASPPSREYEVIVPPYESDMARMVAAYERLSDQYLSLVSQNLTMMDESDRMILRKLETLEKKLDDLAKKVESLNAPKSPEK